MRATLALTMMSSLLACGGGADATGFGGLTPPGLPDETSSPETSADEPPDGPGEAPETSSTGAGTGDGFRWDMGVPDLGAQRPGCGGKVDFLFVISAYGTMEDSQERLLASFSGFMGTIEARYPGFDRHILVANPNTKPGWMMSDCSLCTDDCDPHGEPPYCGAALTNCDKQMGAGVTYPAGLDAANRRCHLAGGLRYITGAQPDVDEAFACIAQVGTDGANSVGEAMVEALRPSMNDPDDEDACNRGFLRDEALLVVTIIADSYDQQSQWSAEEWISALRAAKHGNDDAFAVLVLTTDIDVGYGELCHPELFSKEPNRLRQLVNGVEHGFIASVCLPSFVPFFDEHVGALVELCDEFIPPG